MAIDVSTPEARWIQWLTTTPNVTAALAAFCPHYFYFSKRQVIAFTGLFRQVDPLDRDSLAMLADVLHEELGRSAPANVHSRLFERFAEAVGVTPAELHREPSAVLPGVRAYVDELERAFNHGTRAEALATYAFLESSAVETYGPLVETLRALGYGEEAVHFFDLHAKVEVEHAAAADAMLRRQGLRRDDATVTKQTDALQRLWHRFWTEIHEECQRAVQ